PARPAGWPTSRAESRASSTPPPPARGKAASPPRGDEEESTTEHTEHTERRQRRTRIPMHAVRPRFGTLLVLFSVCSVCSVVGSSSASAEPTYWQDVRPILRKSCTVCHNPRNL